MNGLQNVATLETVQLEVRGGVDGQGMPTYGSPIDILARVVIKEDVVRTPAGQSVRVIATVFVGGEQDPIPQFDDRIATAQSLVGIVIERSDARSIQANELDHVKLLLREE